MKRPQRQAEMVQRQRPARPQLLGEAPSLLELVASVLEPIGVHQRDPEVQPRLDELHRFEPSVVARDCITGEADGFAQPAIRRRDPRERTQRAAARQFVSESLRGGERRGRRSPRSLDVAAEEPPV